MCRCNTPEKVLFRINQVLHIKAKGRGSHCRTNVSKYGFPESYLPRRKSFYGFQTGDMIKAIVQKANIKGYSLEQLPVEALERTKKVKKAVLKRDLERKWLKESIANIVNNKQERWL